LFGLRKSDVTRRDWNDMGHSERPALIIAYQVRV